MYFRGLLFVASAIVGSANASSAESSRDLGAEIVARDAITVTLTSEPGDGSRLVETRILDTVRATAMGLIGAEVPALQATGPQPPPQPRPPLDGTFPSGTTRVDVHQENDYFERDTTFTRVPGGQWFIMNDSIKGTRPAKCYTHPPECDTLPR